MDIDGIDIRLRKVEQFLDERPRLASGGLEAGEQFDADRAARLVTEEGHSAIPGLLSMLGDKIGTAEQALTELDERLKRVEEQITAIWSSDEALSPKIAAIEEAFERYGPVLERLRTEIAQETAGAASQEGQGGAAGGAPAPQSGVSQAPPVVSAGAGQAAETDPSKQPGY